MRRAIAAAVMGGLLFGGTAVTPTSAAAADVSVVPAALGQASPAATTAPAMKTVVYAGYTFQVPASWPVYRLDEHPQTCVRYDVHAVYLGKPGANMRCPAGLIGRTQTVSLIPASSAATGRGSASAAKTTQPKTGGGMKLQQVAAVHSAISQNSATREMKVALGATGTGGTILGTYGTDPGVIEQVIDTLHTAPAGAVQTGQTTPAKTAKTAQTAPAATPHPTPTQRSAAHPMAVQQRATASAHATTTASAHASAAASGTASPHATASPPATTSPHATTSADPTAPPHATPSPTTSAGSKGGSSDPPTKIIQTKQQTSGPVSGFDACTAPSLTAMQAWRKSYTAVGAYIGGVNAACSYGNLSASWIKSVAGKGWEILPTYVGPQAPCWTGGVGVTISPSQAASQGTAAGADAVSDAKQFGLASGSPIYYDMEAYVGGTTCKEALLLFLGAWNRKVAASGYVAAVYSSRDSGIFNVEEWTTAHNKGFTPPGAIWVALWDGEATLSRDRLFWTLSEQSKQYQGNVTKTVGGVTLTIDQDTVGGPVAR